MEENLTTQNGPQDQADGRMATAFELLQALSTEEHRKLESFARALLKRAGKTPPAKRYLAMTSPGDLVNEVFSKVLLGDCNPKLGRRLKRHNREGTPAFLACLRGLIADEVKNKSTRAEAAIPHLPIGDEVEEPGMIDPPDQTDADRLLMRRDLREVLLTKLREQGIEAPELLPNVELWEESFLVDDRVPVTDTGHKWTHQVRESARQMLEELAREQNLGEDGREML